MKNTSILRCSQLEKAFDGTKALRDVNMEFKPGTITAIIGPNGAGKTTLLNVITGFVQADAGACFLGDRKITPDRPHRIARHGIVRTFQDLRLISELTVLDNVLLSFPHQQGENIMAAILGAWKLQENRNKEIALKYLQAVGLHSHAKEAASDLSYGQQKLLALTCCLAAEANIILLDEPVSGVSPYMIEKILELLDIAFQQGKTVIMVEHDLDAVRRVSHYVFVMDCGGIVCQGPPQEVLSSSEIVKVYLD